MSERESIVWSPPAADTSTTVLDEEREKHRIRSERFGTSYIDPVKTQRGKHGDLSIEAKRERLRAVAAKRDVFVTGIDPYSQEEMDKRRGRAERFNVEVRSVLEYKPEEEIDVLAKRAQKFNLKYEPVEAVLMDMDLFEDRAEAGHDVDRRSEAIYLYGVDYLSTRDCLSYFSDYCPLFVEWINDSSAVVVFADPAGCKRAMVGRGRPLPPTDDTPTEGLDPTDLANLPFLWHQGADFNKDGSLIKLIYRMATVVDVKNVDAPRETRELWKQVGSNKAQRRRQDSWQDVDGSVDAGTRRPRRRKKRDKDGGLSILEDVEMEDVEMQDGSNGTENDNLLTAPGGTVPRVITVDMGPESYFSSTRI